MAFSATEAAFEGFRLVRRNPLALVAWTVLYALTSLGALFAMRPALEQLVGLQERADALEQAAAPELDALWALLADFGGIMMQMIWLIPVAMLIEAMLLAAVARGVLTPKNGRLGYLGLGMDEVRVLIVTFVLGLLMTLLWCVALIGVGMMVFAVRLAGGGGWAALVGLIAAIGVVCLMIWLAVRLSLAVPITVAERRFAFFDSFRVTKGRFWPLLGMAIIAGVMVMIVYLVSMMVSVPVSIASGIEHSWGGSSDPEDLRMMLDVSNPWIITGVLIDAIVKALVVGVIYAPFSAAYRDIKGLDEAPAAD